MTERPLLDRFRAYVDAAPDRLFLTDGREALDYGAAMTRIEEVARRLKATAAGRPVLLSGGNRVGWVVHFLATQLSGLPVVILSEQTSRPQIERLQRLLGSCYYLDAERGEGYVEGGVSSPGPIFDEPPIGLLTSGSTGTPRCGLRTPASVLAEGNRYRCLLDLQAGTTLLAPLPVMHAFSLGLVVAGAIACGGTIRLAPRFSPRRLGQELRDAPPDVLALVPSAARLLMAAWGNAPPAEGLGAVVIGAGPLSDELEQQIWQRLGVRPARNYGSSETGATLGTAGEPAPSGVTGKPLPGVEVHVADAIGEVGALFVRTPTPFLGYLTEEGFDSSRISPDGWFSTGDLAAVDDNWVRVVGRLGQGLRRGGRTIEPREVERALRGHPGVRDAVVVGEGDATGEEEVAAHVEVGPESAVEVEELRSHLETQIEAYKIPTLWRFYDRLPRTEGGKPDRSRLGLSRAARSGLSLFSSLAVHRLSAAVTVAQRLGILAYLAEREAVGCTQLADALNLHPGGVALLLRVLAGAGLLERGAEDTFHLPDGSWSPELAGITELETILRQEILSADQIERIVRRGPTTSGLVMPDDSFSELYRNAMGWGLRKVALEAWRRLELPSGPVLDVGRPAGSFADVVMRRQPERPAQVIDVPVAEARPRLPRPTEPAAGIFLHNILRYLQADSGAPLLEYLRAQLRPKGVLIISDIFVDVTVEPSWLRTSLLLDWAAFGSVAWARGEDLCRELGGMGFRPIHRTRPHDMFDLVIANKADA
ncbi:MAG: AMP-binding protein [bacterium]|nr:AMP-binding protein [bacterium]